MRVGIPTPLRSYTKGKASAEAHGATLGEVLSDLDRRFPGLRFRMVDEQERIRPHIKVFKNGDQVFDLATPTGPQDDVAIIQAFSGG